MYKPQKHFSTTKTKQTEATPGKKQIKMRSGGFGFEVDDWTRLDRFLILGAESGTYYASERDLTKMSCDAALRLIQEDGKKVVDRVVEISQAGRAPKNDPALFILAMCAKLGGGRSDKLGIRAYAYQALPRVARIGTHLFHFAEYAKAFGGKGGNGYKRALGRWYMEQQPSKLALQVVKYQQRDGWSHRDLLRLAHPKAPTGDHQAIFEYVVKGRQNGVADVDQVPETLRLIWAWEKAKTLKVEDWREMVKLISDYRLPHECVPNEFKSKPEIWEAILHSGMPPGALLRNLNKLTATGLLTGTSSSTKHVVKVLGDAEALKRARVHPMSVLIASKMYAYGRGFRGSLTWKPVGKISDALDKSFYLTFGAVEPTGKRLCLALDVSGSMGTTVSGVECLTCREAAAAMALVTMNVEDQYEILAYTCGGVRTLKTASRGWYGQGGISCLDISPRQRLDDVVQKMSHLPFSGTDCALPMRWALANKVEVDAFISYTDSESWAGEIHVHQAIKQYRDKMGIPAKSIVVAMATNEYSVADPEDAGQLDVVGFDTSVPNIMSNFIRG